MDSLDIQIKLVKPHHYLFLFASLVFIAAFIVWSILGVVYTRVLGNGLITSEIGNTFYAVASANGSVVDVNVENGEHVKNGEILARVSQLKLQKTIKLNIEKLGNYLEQELIYNKNIKSIDDSSNSHIKLIMNTARQEKGIHSHYESYLRKLLNAQAESLKKKYISKFEYEKLQNEQKNLLIEISSIEKNLSKSMLDHQQIRQTYYDTLINMHFKISDLISTISAQYQELEDNQYIKSPISGYITQILTSKGSYVTPGKTMFVINTNSVILNVLTFFSVYDGKKIHRNMLANISPSTVKKEEYGTIQGKVTTVSNYPLSFAAVNELLKNDELSKEITQGKSAIFAVITLQLKRNSYSGYKWTSKKGPKIKITSGTPAEVSVIIKKTSPIKMAFTFLKKWFDRSNEEN